MSQGSPISVIYQYKTVYYIVKHLLKKISSEIIDHLFILSS